MIVESGLVSVKEFESAKTEAHRAGQKIENVLIGRGDVPESYFFELLSTFYGVPMAGLTRRTINMEVLRMIPEDFAKTRGIAVFDQSESKLKVAMQDPGDIKLIEYLRFKTGSEIEVYLATAADIIHALRFYKGDISKQFEIIIEENIKKALIASPETATLERLAENIPIVTIIDSIIEFAVLSRASDIHFERTAEKLIVRYRIDGILKDITELPKELHPALTARIKILSNLAIDEHFKPQDGRFKFKFEDEAVDVRVSVMPTFHGEKSVLRLLRGAARPLNLEELGMVGKNLAIVKDAITKSHGMILSTGPTGSGKTTTLYAILHLLNKPGVNISTVEDPIEYDVPRLNQTQVNVKAGITFATGLRSLLRQNPDILMVGEIRDLETAEIAVNAALTGHLLLSSLHTNDAITSIPRLTDIGVPKFLMSTTLNLIIAQRLVRKICQSCIESYPVSPEIKKAIQDQFAILYPKEKITYAIPELLYKSGTCPECSVGYQGQVAIFEVLTVTPAMREIINSEWTIEDLRKQARKEGMMTMFEDGLAKVEAGITTIEEILRVIRE